MIKVAIYVKKIIITQETDLADVIQDIILTDYHALNVVLIVKNAIMNLFVLCLLYTSPSPRDRQKSRMPSSA